MAASPGDLSVRNCVVANGTKDASGTVAATAVTISQAGPKAASAGAAGPAVQAGRRPAR